MIQSEEPNECQKTNDQLSGELANASRLAFARLSIRKEEKEEEKDRTDLVSETR